MRKLPLELDDETLEALETERQLIGFESRAAYVRWLIEHRGSISDAPDERERLLEAARERIATLEARLEASRAEDDASERTPTGDPESAAGSEDRRNAASEDDGWRRSKSDPTIEVRGSPRTTVSRDPDADRPAETGRASECERAVTTDGDDALERRPRSAAADERPRSAAVDERFRTAEADERSRTGDVDERSRTAAVDEDAPDGQHGSTVDAERRAPVETDEDDLTPERVVRIPEDPVSADADVLESVAMDRLDELSRRAVAKTRKRLNRDVETGLEYSSSTRLGGGDVRPGEDVVDLEALSVPGRSEERVDRRRAVAGRAIAFLRDERRARKSDFVDALYADHPAGYATPESWWSFVKTALKQVDAIEGGDGSRVWRYTG